MSFISFSGVCGFWNLDGNTSHQRKTVFNPILKKSLDLNRESIRIIAMLLFLNWRSLCNEKLFDKKIGLILDSGRIIDYSNGLSIKYELN